MVCVSNFGFRAPGFSSFSLRLSFQRWDGITTAQSHQSDFLPLSDGLPLSDDDSLGLLALLLLTSLFRA
jgi:hypothetical protein